jgi:hypothetical protein
VPQQEAKLQVVENIGRGREDLNLRPLVPNYESRNFKCFIWCRLGASEPFFLSLSCTELDKTDAIAAWADWSSDTATSDIALVLCRSEAGARGDAPAQGQHCRIAGSAAFI